MAHIELPDGIPGIGGPLTAYPETGIHLGRLAQTLLRGESSLTPAERELIAAYVSEGNECRYCAGAHTATARELYGDAASVVDDALSDSNTSSLSEKMRALLTIAGKVRADARTVSEDDIAAARRAGADDKAIHDTVLTAAAFCMYNRYVDGLATMTPEDPEVYRKTGSRLAEFGYASNDE